MKVDNNHIKKPKNNIGVPKIDTVDMTYTDSHPSNTLPEEPNTSKNKLADELAMLQNVRDLHNKGLYVRAADTLLDYVLQLLDLDNFAALNTILFETASDVLKKASELQFKEGKARVVVLLSLTQPFSEHLTGYAVLESSFDVFSVLRSN